MSPFLGSGAAMSHYLGSGAAMSHYLGSGAAMGSKTSALRPGLRLDRKA